MPETNQAASTDSAIAIIKDDAWRIWEEIAPDAFEADANTMDGDCVCELVIDRLDFLARDKESVAARKVLSRDEIRAAVRSCFTDEFGHFAKFGR